jgi:hypothetical protein
MKEIEEIGAAKPFEARPQPHERRPRHLRLKADEPLEGGERRHRLAGEEHLPREQGAVELASGEDLAHGLEMVHEGGRADARPSSAPPYSIRGKEVRTGARFA